MNEDDLSSWTKHVQVYSFKLHIRANLEIINLEIALYCSTNESSRTGTVIFPLSEIREGAASLVKGL